VARIKDASVDAVKAAADIVEVVSLRTSLRRVSGARFSGRCPFHEEKTPSFSVDPVGKLYYCFGCGKGGDVIRFVQESENLDFAGAIEWLGERFRVTLEFEESSPREDEQRRRRDRLTKLLDQATAYFERILWDTEAGGPVRAYLAERGLGDEVSREFRLGLSRGTGLVAKARESGFSPDEIRAALRVPSADLPSRPTLARSTPLPARAFGASRPSPARGEGLPHNIRTLGSARSCSISA